MRAKSVEYSREEADQLLHHQLEVEEEEEAREPRLLPDPELPPRRRSRGTT